MARTSAFLKTVAAVFLTALFAFPATVEAWPVSDQAQRADFSRADSRLAPMAVEILRNMVQSQRPGQFTPPRNMTMGEFFLRWEASDARYLPRVQPSLDAKILRYKELVRRGRLIDKDMSLTSINQFKALFEEFGVSYCRGQARATLSGFFSSNRKPTPNELHNIYLTSVANQQPPSNLNCGNCVSRALLLTSLWIDSGMIAPRGTEFGVRAFSNHIEAVIYNYDSKMALELIGGTAARHRQGTIYRPHYLVWLALRGYKRGHGVNANSIPFIKDPQFRSKMWIALPDTFGNLAAYTFAIHGATPPSYANAFLDHLGEVGRAPDPPPQDESIAAQSASISASPSAPASRNPVARVASRVGSWFARQARRLMPQRPAALPRPANEERRAKANDPIKEDDFLAFVAPPRIPPARNARSHQPNILQRVASLFERRGANGPSSPRLEKSMIEEFLCENRGLLPRRHQARAAQFHGCGSLRTMSDDDMRTAANRFIRPMLNDLEITEFFKPFGLPAKVKHIYGVGPELSPEPTHFRGALVFVIFEEEREFTGLTTVDDQLFMPSGYKVPRPASEAETALEQWNRLIPLLESHSILASREALKALRNLNQVVSFSATQPLSAAGRAISDVVRIENFSDFLTQMPHIMKFDDYTQFQWPNRNFAIMNRDTLAPRQDVFAAWKIASDFSQRFETHAFEQLEVFQRLSFEEQQTIQGNAQAAQGLLSLYQVRGTDRALARDLTSQMRAANGLDYDLERHLSANLFGRFVVRLHTDEARQLFVGKRGTPLPPQPVSTRRSRETEVRAPLLPATNLNRVSNVQRVQLTASETEQFNAIERRIEEVRNLSERGFKAVTPSTYISLLSMAPDFMENPAGQLLVQSVWSQDLTDYFNAGLTARLESLPKEIWLRGSFMHLQVYPHQLRDFANCELVRSKFCFVPESRVEFPTPLASNERPGFISGQPYLIAAWERRKASGLVATRSLSINDGLYEQEKVIHVSLPRGLEFGRTVALDNAGWASGDTSPEDVSGLRSYLNSTPDLVENWFAIKNFNGISLIRSAYFWVSRYLPQDDDSDVPMGKPYVGEQLMIDDRVFGTGTQLIDDEVNVGRVNWMLRP